MSDTNIRQRSSKAGAKGPSVKDEPDNAPDKVEGMSRVISILDILRIIFTLFAASCALSYYITSGESAFWGYRPWFTRPDVVKAYFKGSINLTPDELLVYDGSNKDLPIYLAINGKIFDVSAGRHTYGPGGSYHVFAGRDATRAFITGCFLEDRTSDLRGAELMYIPVDDENEDITSGEKKKRAERERREAKKLLEAEVKKWEDFYKNSDKYFQVGKVVGAPKHTGTPPELCERSAKGRRKRKVTQQEEKVKGKPVQ